MDHGYEPFRISALMRQSRWAAAALDGIHSSDPSAADAMAAVARLKTVVADGFVPATRTVGIVDPIGAGDGVHGLITPIGGPGAWWDRHQTAASRFADWSDDELFETMAEQLDWFTIQKIAEQPDHFFWSDDLSELAREFRLRAASDPAFAQRLIAEAGQNPMIGLIVAEGGFSNEVLAGVTIATATDGVSAFESGGVRSFVLDRLLAELDGRTEVAITVLGDPVAFEWLFTWNANDHTTRPIDQTLLETILADVLDAPFDDSATLDDVHHVIANVVDLADHEFFDHGFPPGLATTIADGMIPHLPYIIGSLNDLGGVFIKDFDGDRNMVIGTQGEVTDLFGNLLRNEQTRDQIIATVTALTVANDGTLYDDKALSEYIETLLDAAENEQIEEHISAERRRETWNSVIDVVFDLVDKGLAAGGPKSAAARHYLNWFENGARWIVDRIQADVVGLGAVPLSVRVVLSLGIAIVFIGTFRPETDEEEEQHADAQRSLGEIRAAAENPNVSTEGLLARVLDLEEDIENLDPTAFDVIGDPRLRPDNFVPVDDAESSG